MHTWWYEMEFSHVALSPVDWGLMFDDCIHVAAETGMTLFRSPSSREDDGWWIGQWQR